MNERQMAVQAALNRLDQAQVTLDALSLTAQTHTLGVPLVLEKTDQESNQRWKRALADRDKELGAFQMISFLAHRA